MTMERSARIAKTAPKLSASPRLCVEAVGRAVWLDRKLSTDYADLLLAARRSRLQRKAAKKQRRKGLWESYP